MMPKTRDAVLNKNDTRVLGGSLLDAAMAAFGLPRAAASENIGSEVCGARSSHERLETELIPLREDNALLKRQFGCPASIARPRRGEAFPSFRRKSDSPIRFQTSTLETARRM